MRIKLPMIQRRKAEPKAGAILPRPRLRLLRKVAPSGVAEVQQGQKLPA